MDNLLEVSNLNTARQRLGAASNTYTDTVVFGGYTSTEVGVTETWNGSTWSETTDLSTARTGIGGAGSSSSAFAARGTPPAVNITEEWTADLANKTITAS